MRPLQLGLAVAAGILFSALFSFAWTGPQNSPPNCVSGQTGCDAPINVGTTAQFKNGNIGLYGNILLAANGGSYLNFGAISGSTGYGIRDNNGTLEFKSTGGTWNNLTNTVTNVLGIGAVSAIKFSDGTTQTTAAVSASPLLTVCDGSDVTSTNCNPTNVIGLSCSYAGQDFSAGYSYSASWIGPVSGAWYMWDDGTQAASMNGYHACGKVLTYKWR
jgi:hypothetical protein